MKSFFKDYFTFSRRDRAGILILSVMIMAALIVPKILSALQPPAMQTDFSAFKQQIEQYSTQIDSAQQVSKEQYKNYGSKRWNNEENDNNNPNFDPTEAVTVNLQPFDPNQLTYQTARQLGLPARTAHTIENFLQKGGKFYKKEDLKKIYVLSEADYQRLEPYIQIPAKDTKPSNTQTAEIPTTYSSSGKARQPTKVSKPININTSDTTQWQQLKGIGSGYARQIVKLRSQLGGFATKEQLKEVYGMTPELYSQIEPYLQGAGTVKQININKATADEMKTHPYIKYKLADAIVKYRQQHGGYKAISDIKNIKILSEDNYTKLAPYLTLN